MPEAPRNALTRLESWKEIARHFDVNTRTVQLWEKERGLPVRRLPGPRGRVFAFAHELDAWATGQTLEVAPADATGSRFRRGALVAALAFLLAATFWILAASRRSQVVSCRVEGQALIALDLHGREVWRFNLGRPRPPAALAGVGDKQVDPWVGDLDGDRGNELLLADLQDGTPNFDRLLCFSGSGRLLWSFTPGRVVSSGRERFDPPFRIASFRVVRLGPGRGSAVVLTARHQLYYPFQAALLSPKGALLGEYWHSGHLVHLATADLDGDGRDTIYLSGVSNGSKSAALVVLDPLTMGGASREQNPDYQLQGFSPPREVARILLPVSRPARGLSDYGVATQTIVLQGSIATMVNEASSIRERRPEVIFHFDPALQLTRVEPADNHETALRLAGRPNQRLTAQDIEEMKQQVIYLTRPSLGR